MLQRIRTLPSGIDGFRAIGEVTRNDYRQILEPVFEEARREDRRLRLLFEFGEEFQGYSRGAVWEDARVGFRHLRRFDRCAILTDIDWLRSATRFLSTLLPFPLRVFPSGARSDAIGWLASPIAGSRTRHRILDDRGVLEVEVDQSLRAEDFDAIAATVDPWIETRGALSGLVILAPRFPGWENLSAFLGHIHFVREHHRRIRRIAVVTEGRITEQLPKLVDPFVDAELRVFHPDKAGDAIDWAADDKASGVRHAS
jgi:hypothetical protein